MKPFSENAKESRRNFTRRVAQIGIGAAIASAVGIKVKQEASAVTCSDYFFCHRIPSITPASCTATRRWRATYKQVFCWDGVPYQSNLVSVNLEFVHCGCDTAG